MKYWTTFKEYNFTIDKKTEICEDIFTFDIETTSLIKYNDKFYPAVFYDKLTDDEKELTESFGFMYIWQFGINENIYYGRTWDEFETFLKKINTLCNSKKIIYVHNLSFEFQFLRNQFKFKKVFARTMRHILKCELEYYNFEFRCSLMLSNVKLAKLSEIYKLPVAKLEGDLDYNVIRSFKTKMTMRELRLLRK